MTNHCSHVTGHRDAMREMGQQTDPVKEMLRRMIAEFGDQHYHTCPADNDTGPCDCFAGHLLNEARQVIDAGVAQSIAPSRVQIGKIIDPEAAWGFVVESDSPANERIKLALSKVDAILTSLSSTHELVTNCDKCGLALQPDDHVFASLNHGVRKTVHIKCPDAQTRPTPEELFCDWLRGYLDELTSSEANTIRNWLDALTSVSSTLCGEK